MTPDEIRIELYKRRKRVSQAAIARDLGVSRQALWLVIDRKMGSRRIREAIAKAIDRDLCTVFPEELSRASNAE
jgi:transcriptional regulator with XRE-family HTH domain